MSPAKFNVDEDPARRLIHGPRPSPLKINKDSHFIHKTSSSPSSSSIHDAAPVAVKQQQQPQRRQQPVIIYTHSPKIIHTQPRDFMALVQKLTGQSRTEGRGRGNGDGNDSASLDQKESRSSRKIIMAGGGGGVSHDNDNESSSVLTSDEINGGGGSGGGGDSIKIGNSNSSSTLNFSNPLFGDIPLFTPNGGRDFFCSPRPGYRFQDTLSPSPNMGASLSPSFLEFMKGLPDY